VESKTKRKTDDHQGFQLTKENAKTKIKAEELKWLQNPRRRRLG
jgi:hypothetical protein